MNRFCWWLVDVLSRTLDPDERDAVRGDFAESGESGAHALRDLAGLVVRRQAMLWRGWRPWLATLGLVVPVLSSGLGFAWIRLQFRTVWTYGVRYDVGLPLSDDIVRLLCFPVLSMAWAWSGGFALGSLSRRTAWLHPAVVCPAAWFSATLLSTLLSSRLHRALFWLLPLAVLVLIPFLRGVHRGVRRGALGIGHTVWLAASIAALTLVAQVEGGRESRAFTAWSSGGTLNGPLAWTPQVLPFAAIVWQFIFVFATTRFKENSR
jgi:hypothetical protein